MDMKPWLGRVADPEPAVVARKIGMSTSTFDGQLKSAKGLRPETVVKVARAYGADPVAALVELGLLTPEEVGGEVDLSEADHLAWLAEQPDDVLLIEIQRRLEKREPWSGETGAEPESGPDSGDDGGTVTPIKPKPSSPSVVEREYPQPQKRAARKRPGKPRLGDD
jgi:hypothetical protein